MSLIRVLSALVLVAIAVTLALVCCRWGTDLDSTPIMLMPGSTDRTGLFTRSWLVARPSVSMFLGIGIPILLITIAAWTSGLCREQRVGT